METLGLDLSLANTGVVFLKEDGGMRAKNIKRKPSGKKPMDELMRLISIKEEIEIFINTTKPKLVAIEGIAFGIRKTTALSQLSGLNYLMREVFYDLDIPFIIVAPTTLKKFVTGKGNSPKDIMMLETHRRFGVTITDNNICDAYNLAKCAMAVLNKIPKLIKPQEEVVALLKKQL